MPSGKTHFVAGVLLSGAGLYYTGGPMEYALAGGAAALLPDIDHKNSTLGRFLPFHLIFKHRGFTHSYLAFMILFWLALIFTKSEYTILAIANGYLSHIWLDYLTPRGVQLWWPNKRYCSLRNVWKGGKRK